jgi:hypothetical protein
MAPGLFRGLTGALPSSPSHSSSLSKSPSRGDDHPSHDATPALAPVAPSSSEGHDAATAATMVKSEKVAARTKFLWDDDALRVLASIGT